MSGTPDRKGNARDTQYNRTERAHTHPKPMPARISKDIAEDQLEVVHDDKSCQVDLKPVLPLPLLDLAIELPEDHLPERYQQYAQRDVVDLGVHNGCDRNDATIWAFRIVGGFEGREVAFTNPPWVLDEAGGNPEG